MTTERKLCIVLSVALIGVLLVTWSSKETQQQRQRTAYLKGCRDATNVAIDMQTQKLTLEQANALAEAKYEVFLQSLK